jgi:cytochrome c peroxidase
MTGFPRTWRALRALPLSALLALAACGDGGGGSDAAAEISQQGKAFDPNAVTIAAGETIVLHNDDKRTHNIRVFHPKMDYNSGSQDPGEDVRLTFEAPGTYWVTCGIHPQMELKVEVTARAE